MSKVNELFMESGRPNQGDNRNYFVKALNKVLEDGFITIKLQKSGFVWTNPKYVDSNGELKKFNIEIRGYGHIYRVFLRQFTAMDLLLYVGKFIQNPQIAEKHINSISVDAYEICKCSRCMGKGRIEQFNYYCDGICFQCYGSQYDLKKKTVTV